MHHDQVICKGKSLQSPTTEHNYAAHHIPQVYDPNWMINTFQSSLQHLGAGTMSIERDCYEMFAGTCG